MASQPADSPTAESPFTEYLTSTAGDQLIGIIRYSDDGYTIQHYQDEYLDYLDAHAEDIVDLHRDQNTESPTDRQLDVGSRHATVRLYERVVVIDFPHPNAEGVIVVFNPSVAPRLTKFVHDSESLLHGST